MIYQSVFCSYRVLLLIGTVMSENLSLYFIYLSDGIGGDFV